LREQLHKTQRPPFRPCCCTPEQRRRLEKAAFLSSSSVDVSDYLLRQLVERLSRRHLQLETACLLAASVSRPDLRRTQTASRSLR